MRGARPAVRARRRRSPRGARSGTPRARRKRRKRRKRGERGERGKRGERALPCAQAFERLRTRAARREAARSAPALGRPNAVEAARSCEHTVQAPLQRGDRLRQARPEAEQKQRIERHDAPRAAGRRRAEAGRGEQRIAPAHRLQPFVGDQHDVGRRRDERLGGQRLVAVEPLHRVVRARVADHRVGGRLLAGDERLVAGVVQHEQHARGRALAPARRRGVRRRARREPVAIEAREQHVARRLQRQRVCDAANLAAHRFDIVRLVERRDGDARARELRQRGRRAGFRRREHDIGAQRQQAFRRQRALVADLRQPSRGFRIRARGVGADEFVARGARAAERVDRLGERAADRDHALGRRARRRARERARMRGREHERARAREPRAPAGIDARRLAHRAAPASVATGTSAACATVAASAASAVSSLGSAPASSRQPASSGCPGLRAPNNIAMLSPAASNSSTDVTAPSLVGFLTTHADATRSSRRCRLKSSSSTLIHVPMRRMFVTAPVWIWIMPRLPTNTMIGSRVCAARSSTRRAASVATRCARDAPASRSACVRDTPWRRTTPWNWCVSVIASHAARSPAASISPSGRSTCAGGAGSTANAGDCTGIRQRDTNASNAA
ncbi:hypothetical protein BURPS1710b_A1779 [Burkholderia pseudomallei 1710b]|uniref:Uncharacterized protein n=1 Tax=Burkholderia pseudomallei (strain 1710b) TaxID=320372 RepID=Q3JHL8_BURP1|nr:hypothetical protein BURPS1710b_A1779 [Burkholderia pseudomallei 1710b]